MKSTHIARPVVDKKRILRSELHARNNQTDQPSLRFIEIKCSRRWTRNLAYLKNYCAKGIMNHLSALFWISHQLH